MHLRERLQSGAGPSLSFEFFPPKNEQAASALYQTIRELEPYRPSFVSVTYGAGGSTRELTREVVLRIQHESRIPTVPHLTCVGHSREEVWNILDQYARAGVRAVLALRGDPPRGAKDYNRDADVFRHAADLVTFIREYNESGRHPDPDGFAIGVAGFPEGHPATPNRLREMDFLKAKVDAGADYICTQLFLTIILFGLPGTLSAGRYQGAYPGGNHACDQPVRHEPHGRAFRRHLFSGQAA